ncbi:aminoglycoside phosphotransferase family protein [Streptomyces sp. G7(2002)]|uniref:aminoglycoside phosphotransferase family protein n=1 Tax=Streptomyces sp. G7(2002) TaxID=2971798 RepID=UPI00237DBF7B|nr:phosphotransferase [Streptomyces sp. G7(2002)]WDT54174.1 aminoglycoside phosphotransferase family protein [Streptomyces sp. G7(2002)]
MLTSTPMARPRMSIPGSVLDWASYVIGPITLVRHTSWDRGNSKVWELTCPDSTRYFLKISPSKALYARETHAYRFAVPSLGPDRAPRLQAADPDQLALLLTAAPGQPVAAGLTMRDLLKVHRQVGWLLRALHDAPRASSSASWDFLAEVRARTESVGKHVAAAGDLLTRAEQETVLRLARNLPHLEACPAAFIHGDAQERNVLWDGRSDCAALLDFERARPALAVDDFVHLAVGPWQQQPRLRRVFFTGYGRELTGPERQVLPALAAADAVSGLVWGTRAGDNEIAHRARVTLKLLCKGAVL